MKIKKKKVDFVLSCGAACRPARYTQVLRMRLFSSPCDWMMSYSLNDFIAVLDTQATSMFKDARLDTVKKWVVDDRNGMISMHDFDCNQDLSIQLPSFYEKMQRRAKNTVERIEKSSSVGIIMNRMLTSDELITFAEALSQRYPKVIFSIVNIKDNPHIKVAELTYSCNKESYNIYEVSFDDAHIDGRSQDDNPNFWLGNEEMWKNVLNKCFSVKWSKLRVFKSKIKGILSKIVKK